MGFVDALLAINDCRDLPIQSNLEIPLTGTSKSYSCTAHCCGVTGTEACASPPSWESAGGCAGGTAAL